MIVEIKARDLKPGDVVLLGSTRCTLVYSAPLEFDTHAVALHFVELGRGAYGALAPSPWAEAAMFNVERPDPLTPAQQHADELLVMVRRLTSMHNVNGPAVEDGRQLLDKIDPPKPATLEEAVALLRQLAERTNTMLGPELERFLARVPK